MQKRILFTQKGYDEKQKEYDELLASRPDAVRELTKARDMGDLSENGYYKGARFKLSDIDRNLRRLKYILQFGKVQQTASLHTVDIGVRVTINDEKQTKTYEIVGTYESNPRIGKISLYSPLGKLLMGKGIGDTVTLTIGEKKTTYVITKLA